MTNDYFNLLATAFLGIILMTNVQAQAVHDVGSSEANGLENFIENTSNWNAGDTILLTGDTYIVNGTIDIFQEITIKGDPNLSTRPKLIFYDNGFRPKEDSISMSFIGFDASGMKEDSSRANHFLRTDLIGFKDFNDILLEDMRISYFLGGIELYKNEFGSYKSLTINNCIFHDISHELAFLSEYTIDPRKSSIEELQITNSTFSDVAGILGEMYWQNTEEAQQQRYVEQDVVIENNTFFKVGAGNKSFIQTNRGIDGSISLSFNNNIVSTLFTDDARLFRINELAGDFAFSHNVFHDFNVETAGRSAYNLDSVVRQSNVDTSNVYREYPAFADTALTENEFSPYDLSISKGSSLLTAGTNGQGIGDPRWLPDVEHIASSEHVHRIPNTSVDTLEKFIENPSLWAPGDTILLVSGGTYVVNGTIDIFQEITVMGDPALGTIQPKLVFEDNGFRAKEDSISITLKGFDASGLKSDSSRANHLLRMDQFVFRVFNDILIEDVNVHYFNGGIELFRNEFGQYKSVTINNCTFHDIGAQIGADYVINPSKASIKQLTVTNSTFSELQKGFLGEMYWQITEEEAQTRYVDQEVIIDHNTFYSLAANSLIQNNNGSDGSIDLTFSNNIVSTINFPQFSRIFRINENAGSFTFSNNVFHDFISTQGSAEYTLDSVVQQANVDTSNIYREGPNFADNEFTDYDPNSFDLTLPHSSQYLTAGTDNDILGDPRWMPQEGVNLEPITEQVYVGENIGITVSTNFDEGTDASVSWEVVNNHAGTNGQANINSEGVLSPTAEGKVLVRVTSVALPAFTDSIVVNILPPKLVTDITISGQNPLGDVSNEIITEGNSLNLNAQIIPIDATNRDITWSVSDDNLATIDSTGRFEARITATGNASGTVDAIATATDGSGVMARFEVVLTNQNNVTGVTISTVSGKSRVNVGDSLQFTASVEPENPDSDSIIWEVNYEDIATISEQGLLKAVAPGEVGVRGISYDQQFISGDMEVIVNALPIVANAIEDQTLGEGFGSKQISLSNVFDDDNDDELTFSVSNSNDDVVTHSTSEGQLILTEAGVGSSEIIITADDGYGGTVNDTFSVTVDKAPSVVNNIGDRQLNEGFGLLQFDLSNVFEDDDALSFSAISSEETVVTTNLDNASLTITEVGTGTANIIITATDSNGGTAKDTFSVVINQSPTVIKSINNQTFDAGFGTMEISLASVFADNDGDSLRFTAASDNESVITVSVTDSTLMLTEANSGSANITLTANDGRGGAASDTFQVEVISDQQVLNIEDNAASESMIAYPNPFEDQLHIQSGNNGPVEKVTIYHSNGQLVKQIPVANSTGHRLTLNTADIAPGVYVIYIECKSGEKIIKALK